jgi:hypothetical protein
MTDFDLPTNFIENPESLVRRVRPLIVPPQITLPFGRITIDLSITLSDPGLRDYVYNIVHTGLGDRTCPIPYLCCTLLACGVGLAGTEGNYSSCTRV